MNVCGHWRSGGRSEWQVSRGGGHRPQDTVSRGRPLAQWKGKWLEHVASDLRLAGDPRCMETREDDEDDDEDE